MHDTNWLLLLASHSSLLLLNEELAVPQHSTAGVFTKAVRYPLAVSDHLNAASRIRVVEKGRKGKGVRAVRDATNSHYEVLRTLLDSFVAEATLIAALPVAKRCCHWLEDIKRNWHAGSADPGR
ncbi:hypothetical protein [Micromonospora taraxaci]